MQAKYRRKASRRKWEAEINKREVEREGMYSQWRYRWLNGPVGDIHRRKRSETNISSDLKRKRKQGPWALTTFQKKLHFRKSLQPHRGCFQVIWAFVASLSTAGNVPSLTSWCQKENPWSTLQKQHLVQWQVLVNNSGVSELQQYDWVLIYRPSALKRDPYELPLFCRFSRRAVWCVYWLGSCRRQNAESGQVGSQAHCG